MLLQMKTAKQNAYNGSRQEQCIFSEVYHSMGSYRLLPSKEEDKKLQWEQNLDQYEQRQWKEDILAELSKVH